MGLPMQTRTCTASAARMLSSLAASSYGSCGFGAQERLERPEGGSPSLRPGCPNGSGPPSTGGSSPESPRSRPARPSAAPLAAPSLCTDSGASSDWCCSPPLTAGLRASVMGPPPFGPAAATAAACRAPAACAAGGGGLNRTSIPGERSSAGMAEAAGAGRRLAPGGGGGLNFIVTPSDSSVSAPPACSRGRAGAGGLACYSKSDAILTFFVKTYQAPARRATPY